MLPKVTGTKSGNGKLMALKMGLTDASILAIKAPSDGQIEISDKIVPGLRLRVGTSGAKTFILRKRVAGKLRNLTLGRHTRLFGLAAARKKARDLLVDIESGKDIDRKQSSKRKSASDAATVSELFEVYLANEVIGRKRTAREIERTFRYYIIPAIGDRMADTVTRGDVTRLIETVAFERGRATPRMARGVHQQLSSFYTWAMPKLDRLPANPCRDAWRPKASVARDRVLSDRELKALWLVAEEEGDPFGFLVQLLILTAQRRGEVLNASWSEFDFKQHIWTIPAQRAKNGVANIVPLSSQALKILKALAEDQGVDLNERVLPDLSLFPSRTNEITNLSGLSKAWKRIVKAMEVRLECDVAHFTMHDIRRTVATGLQAMAIPLVVSEAVLNHQSGSSRSGVAGVYHRHHFTVEKRDALEQWGSRVVWLSKSS